MSTPPSAVCAHAPASALTLLASATDTAPILRALQQQARAALDKYSSELTAAFRLAADSSRADPGRSPTTVQALRCASRESTTVVLARRKLARDLVVAALRNRANPDWNPIDPKSWHTDPEDALWALIRMPPLT